LVLGWVAFASVTLVRGQGRLRGGEFLDIAIELNWPDGNSEKSWTQLDMYLQHRENESGHNSLVHRIRVESLFIPKVHLQCSMQGTYVGVWTASINVGPHGTLEGTFYPNEGKEARRIRKPGCAALEGNIFLGLILGAFLPGDQDYFAFDVLVFEVDSNGKAERVGLAGFYSKASSRISTWLVESLSRTSIILW